MSFLSAEPASIFYIATGAVCLFFNRSAFSRRTDSSTLMLFCQKTTRERLSRTRLI